MLTHYPGKSVALLFNNFWGIIYILPLNYILFEYTLPYIGRKRRYVVSNILWGLLLIWLHLMFYSYGSYAWRELGMFLHVYTDILKFTSLNKALEFQMTYSAVSLFVFGVSRHVYMYIRLKQTSQQLRIEKQEAELNYLRSQTNPHFLFNTLNNIYSLTRDKSDLAPESVLKLSKILRFMLYETGGDYIAIEQEIKIIGDYIELERLRYDESLRVNFNYDIADMKQSIPPLLLIPLVENAFKHGVSETRHHPFVDIRLSIKNKLLEFTVKNSADSGFSEKPVKENIGLSNLRRQLELLYKEYSLELRQGQSDFTSILKIKLSSHV